MCPPPPETAFEQSSSLDFDIPDGFNPDTMPLFEPDTVLYFVDLDPISNPEAVEWDELFNLAISGDPDDSTNLNAYLYGFTEKEDLLLFASGRGIPLTGAYEIADHLHAYADSTGAIAYTDDTGEVSEAYAQYEEAYILNPNRPSFEFISGGTFIWECCFGSCRSTIVPSFFPVMFGWNNRASAYGHYITLFPPFRLTGFFGRTYYRTPTTWHYGVVWNRFNFCFGNLAHLNNGVSSIISQ